MDSAPKDPSTDVQMISDAEGPPQGHLVASGNNPDGSMSFDCTCGAHWKVSEKEFQNGIDHIEDHYRYARKAPTRVD